MTVLRYGDGGAVQARYQYERDGLGHLIGVTDADGNVREISRDGAGRPAQITGAHGVNAQSGFYTVCYDPQDNPIRLQSPEGRTLLLDRDELGRVIRTRSESPKPGEEPSVAYQSYDDSSSNGLGRLARLADDSGITSFGYDANGYTSDVEYRPSGLVREPQGAGAGLHNSYQAHFAYSPTGHLKRTDILAVQDSPHRTLALAGYQYTRDVFGRVQTLKSLQGTQSETLVTVAAFDELDRVTQSRFGNGTQANWTWDPRTDWLKAIRYDLGRQTLLSLAYPDYDPNGNLLTEQVSRIRDSATQATSYRSTYIYDALDQLIGWTRDSGLGRGTQEGYSYSPGGNIRTAAGATYQYELPESPQAVTRIVGPGRTDRSLTYDRDGWLETDIVGASDERSLNYDASGCLRQVLSPQQTTTFVCGQGGRKVLRKTVDHDGNTERVIDFAGLAELRPDDGPGIVLVRLTVAGSTAVQEAKRLADGLRDSAHSSYLYKNARGDVLAERGLAAGSPPATLTAADYDPWGNTESIGLTPVPKHAYVDHEPDPGLGWYHFGPRVYDPQLRRWLSPDPLLLALPELDEHSGLELNLYAYGRNNPVRFVDKGGHQAQALVLAAENPEATVGSIVIAMPPIAAGLVFGGLIYQHRQDIADAAASALNAMAKAEPREVTLMRMQSSAIHQLLSPTQVQAASTAPPVTPAEAAPAAEGAAEGTAEGAGYWPGSVPADKSVAPPRTGAEGAPAKGAHLNSNGATSNFGLYEIRVNRELYKIGKADLNRVTQSSGQPTRLHQQVRKLEQVHGKGNVEGHVVEKLGQTTTAEAKAAETARIRAYHQRTGTVPPGNQKSYKP